MTMTMKSGLYLVDGTEVSKDEIRRAVAEHRAVICWSHGNWVNLGTLSIYADAETAAMEAERDTRGQCWSMADEVWSEMVTSVGQATRAAAGLLKVN